MSSRDPSLGPSGAWRQSVARAGDGGGLDRGGVAGGGVVMVWTHFWDMYSGGVRKLDWKHIYIEAPEDEAKVIFYNRFGRNPERVTCTCCGPDYSITEIEDLEHATAFHRRLAHDKTLEAYMNNPSVLFIHASGIKPEERQGEVPPEGYIWHGA